LVRISGLSHGTDVWTNNGQELVREGVATLKEIIPSRDDIMVYLIYMGVDKKTAFKIMESVRKGKGVSDAEAGQMLDAGVPEWYVESCRKIKYLFPKAHAVAYVLMTVRIAYFKIHHQEAFYAAAFSVRADDFDYASMCLGADAAREEYARLKESEDSKKNGAESTKDKNTIALLELLLEMYGRGIKFAPLDLYKSEVYRFLPTGGGILPPLCTVQGLGHSVAEAIVEARQDGPFDTVEIFKKRSKVNKTVLELLRGYGVLDGVPETDQMSLFD
jgi:DNA polymerase-3 subunit alpha (Gram-positive type)